MDEEGAVAAELGAGGGAARTASAKRSCACAAARGAESTDADPGARRAMADAFARWSATESACVAGSARTETASPVSRATELASAASTVRASPAA